ncbi:Lipase, class 3 [Artemisia annua]|uniref:Lipase, class 3 n=1 Tax=Artemisia annua TaxID=35608 RepID=A0A2U1MHT9_ARTAN|nr:Lipase, class 3 [Artemisia annua]
MSVLCCCPILECVYCLGCARWAWKKCLYTAGRESENWGHATASEFEPVPRICRYILAVYEYDIRNPLWAPPGGYGIDPDQVVLKKDYDENQGKVSPYMIYIDKDNREILLLISGLNLAKESDYLLLLDDKLGQTKFDGGYVHNGLLKAAQWVFDNECEVLKELVEKYEDYTLTFAGHSLGAGVVTLLTMLVVKNRDRIGNIDRKRIKCFSIAPARCVSLNLAVRYADVINSVVLQDDFMPRTSVALEVLFKYLCCFPCILCGTCIMETFTLQQQMLQDPRRLYAPGRLYHVIVRKPFGVGRISPVVKTAVPVDGRFEHMVISCHVLTDHSIALMEREFSNALDTLKEKDRVLDIPPQQRMERSSSIAIEHTEEHRAALARAVALDVPESYSPSEYGTFRNAQGGDDSEKLLTQTLGSSRSRESWDELAVRLFETDESGQMVLKTNVY